MTESIATSERASSASSLTRRSESRRCSPRGATSRRRFRGRQHHRASASSSRAQLERRSPGRRLRAARHGAEPDQPSASSFGGTSPPGRAARRRTSFASAAIGAAASARRGYSTPTLERPRWRDLPAAAARERADRLLERHLGDVAAHLVEVDPLEPEPPQAALERRGAGTRAGRRVVRAAPARADPPLPGPAARVRPRPPRREAGGLRHRRQSRRVDAGAADDPPPGRLDARPRHGLGDPGAPRGASQRPGHRDRRQPARTRVPPPERAAERRRERRARRGELARARPRPPLRPDRRQPAVRHLAGGRARVQGQRARRGRRLPARRRAAPGAPGGGRRRAGALQLGPRRGRGLARAARALVRGRGVDALLLRYETFTPLEYATAWNASSGPTRRRSARRSTAGSPTTRGSGSSGSRGATSSCAAGRGATACARSRCPAGRPTEPGAARAHARRVGRAARRRRAAGGDPAPGRGRRARAALAGARRRLDGGTRAGHAPTLGFAVPLDDDAAAVLAACDGETTVADAIGRAGETAGAVLPALQRLHRLGCVEPVGKSGAPRGVLETRAITDDAPKGEP